MRKARWLLITAVVLAWGSAFTMGHYGVPGWGTLGVIWASTSAGVLVYMSFIAAEDDTRR